MPCSLISSVALVPPDPLVSPFPFPLPPRVSLFPSLPCYLIPAVSLAPLFPFSPILLVPAVPLFALFSLFPLSSLFPLCLVICFFILPPYQKLGK